MSLVIDCSVAAKWLFLEEGSSKAESILKELSFFFVPDLFVVEIDTVISKKVRQREISSEEAFQKIVERKKLPYQTLNYTDISKLALEISVSLPLTLYDATYIATAIEKHAVVYTADQRLVNSVSKSSLNKYVESIWDLG
ncbi:type II toxin-antitoxin system VapC family toxin [Fodinibius sp. AD559]|uniref:type II toxin-antitoxin system VapC family toxin n=1 Tax=Fodinibius sp. AD559 TaxID=3424179 RepID=UPI004046EB7C